MSRYQERAAQARITDLEMQLSRATASAAQLKKAKDEVQTHSDLFYKSCNVVILMVMMMIKIKITKIMIMDDDDDDDDGR